MPLGITNCRSSSLKLVRRVLRSLTARVNDFTVRRARLRLYRLQKLWVSNVVKAGSKNPCTERERDGKWWRLRGRLLRSCGRRRYLSLACRNPHRSISSPLSPLSNTKIPTEHRLVPCAISFYRSLFRHYFRALSFLMLFSFYSTFPRQLSPFSVPFASYLAGTPLSVFPPLPY